MQFPDVRERERREKVIEKQVKKGKMVGIREKKKDVCWSRAGETRFEKRARVE
jgi:hypothetical protein